MTPHTSRAHGPWVARPSCAAPKGCAALSGVFLVLASFLASAVEMVEALTIVLAAAVTRGWRSSLVGVGGALVVLAVITAQVGPHCPSAKQMGLAGAAAVAALVIGVGGALAIRQPLSRVPENTLKFAVGLMLSTFGTFWAAEGAGVSWPGSDGAILGILAVYLIVSYGFVRLLRRRRTARARAAA